MIKRWLLILPFSLIVFTSEGQVHEIFPGFLDDPTFVYHPPSKGMLLLGGTPVVQDSTLAEVWKWSGEKWQKINAIGPGSRVFFKGGLNTHTQNIEFYAGAGLARAKSQMRDWWLFDGKKWTEKKLEHPETHDHHKMIYVDHIKAFLIYGGNIGHRFDTTTWIVRDGVFTALACKGPGVKYQYPMVYDKRRKKVVLYGGGEKADELWEFDGKAWAKIDTKANPGIKLYHHMAYDEEQKLVVLHGGQINHRPLDPINLEPPLTWTWDGIAWKKIAQEKIFAIAIGYHPTRKSVLAYGYNDGNFNNTRNIQLWELKNNKWNMLQDYGSWNTTQYLEQFLTEHPNNDMALYAYAYNLKNANRLPEAEAIFKRITDRKHPQIASIYRGLIDALVKQNKLEEAEIYIRRSEPFNNKLVLSTQYYNLGCAFAISGNTNKAFEMLHKAMGFGYKAKKDYESDEDLNSLKNDPRWKILIDQLE